MPIQSHFRRAMIVAFLLTPFGAPAESVPSSTSDADRTPVLRVFALPGYQVRSFQKAVIGEIHFDPATNLSVAMLASDVSGPCSSTLPMPAPDPSVFDGKASASWRIEGTLLSTDGDRATIDVRWRRRIHRRQALVEGETMGEQRITLQDGATGILDVVRAAPGAERVCGSFAIGIELGFRSSTAHLVNTGIDYDLWLVDRSSRNPATPARTRASAHHDQEATYVFPPVKLMSSVGEVSLNVSGAVTGRARTDGTIDISLDTWQSYSVQGGGFGRGGRKRVVVQAGETVEFELPEDLRAGLPPDLRQHPFGLRVTATRLW
jgi:hypothetical protein